MIPTSSNPQPEMSYVFEELNKTVQVLGLPRLMETLKYLREAPTTTLTDEIIEKSLIVMVIVCDEFKITIEDLHGHKRNNNRMLCIGIVAFLLQSRLNLDNTDISYILKKPESVVSIYKKTITNLNSKFTTDARILEKIESIKKSIKKQLK